jgi:DNA replication protein DnaC
MSGKHLLLTSYLKKLRLPEFCSNFEEVARDAANANQSYEEYLFALVSQEVIKRDQNRRHRLIKQAQFPIKKTLTDFEFNAIPSLNEKKILQLSECDYIARKENIIFIGDGGTGKTHLAIALGLLACDKDFRVGFYSVAGLINQLVEARKELQLNRIMKKLSKLDLIVCDELGYLPLGQEGAHLLFQALSERYERRSTIVTTNLGFSDWGEVFPSDRAAGALIDRLTHHCHIIEMYGDSYRLKEGLSKKEAE